jgi:hypothetical protein
MLLVYLSSTLCFSYKIRASKTPHRQEHRRARTRIVDAAPGDTFAVPAARVVEDSMAEWLRRWLTPRGTDSSLEKAGDLPCSLEQALWF